MNDPSGPRDEEEKPATPWDVSRTVTAVLAVSAVFIAAHMGLKYQSWQVFLLFLLPLLVVALLFARVFRAMQRSTGRS